MLPLILTIHVHVHVAALAAARRLARLRDERGQTSAEYALVLLGAASVALLIAVWAKNTNKLGRLLDTVFDNLVKLVR